MKRSKGIGPNNLGVSKSAVKNQNKGYGDYSTMTKQTNPSNAELGGGGANKEAYKAHKEKEKKEQKEVGSKPESNQNMADSMTKASKYGAMIKANIDKGMNPTEAGKQAAIDIKKEK